MMVRVLVIVIAMMKAFNRVNFSYYKCANCKKISRHAGGREAAGRR